LAPRSVSSSKMTSHVIMSRNMKRTFKKLTLTWILFHALSIHPAQVPDRYVVWVVFSETSQHPFWCISGNKSYWKLRQICLLNIDSGCWVFVISQMLKTLWIIQSCNHASLTLVAKSTSGTSSWPSWRALCACFHRDGFYDGFHHDGSILQSKRGETKSSESEHIGFVIFGSHFCLLKNMT